MSDGIPADDILVFRDTAARDAHYEATERTGEPFLAVDAVEGGFTITYDLLPAGHLLTEEGMETLTDVVRDGLESVLNDESQSVTELSAGVGPQLGSVSAFDREETAREFASMLSAVVLDETNWRPDD